MKFTVRASNLCISWEQRKLGDIASSFAYGLNAAAKEFDGKHKYLRITDIDDVSRVFQDDNLTSPDADIDAADDYRLEEGDLLFARTGASVGKSYIYKESDGLVYYAGFLIRAKIRPEYDAEFVFQNTLTSTYEKYIKTTSQRSGQPGVNAKEYAEYSMSLPEYAEQVKIGMFLRKIDDAITLHQRKLDDLRLLKKSMLQKMFPKEGKDVPETRFPGFTDAWEQRKLGDCFSERAESNPNGELLSVTIGSGIRKFFELGRHDNSNEDKSKYKRVYVGDIAYNSMRMWQGASGYSPYNGIVSPAYTVIKPFEGIDSKFFAYLFKCENMIHTFQIHSQGITSDTWNLKFPAFSQIDVLFPSDTKEQKVIADYLTFLDNLITLHQRKKEYLYIIKVNFQRGLYYGI